MNRIPNVPPSVCLKVPSSGLQVDFEWSTDRYQHRVSHGQASVLTSIEGDSDQAWPPSPPLQQLSLEHLDGRDVVLGVGAAGKSHWSLCVQPVEITAGDLALRFEWACRTSDPTPNLNSSYRQLDPNVSVIPGADARSENQEFGLSIQPAESSASKGTWQWSYDVRIPKSTS